METDNFVEKQTAEEPKKIISSTLKTKIISVVIILLAASFSGGILFNSKIGFGPQETEVEGEKPLYLLDEKTLRTICEPYAERNWKQSCEMEAKRKCEQEKNFTYCEKVDYLTDESIQATNKTLKELPACFAYGTGYDPQLDLSGGSTFIGYGFDVSYPEDQVVITKTDDINEPFSDNPNFSRISTYEIKLKDSEEHAASIRVYRLNWHRYVARYKNSNPVIYEPYSNTWWEEDGFNSGNISDKQCNPNAIGRTSTNNFPIYTYGDGDAGVSYTRYVVVMRETSSGSYKGGWTEPVVVEFTIGNDYNESESYIESREKLNNIVESMVETIELYPTSKG